MSIEVRALTTSHAFVIPPIPQLIPTTSTLVFGLFEDDEPPIDRVNKALSPKSRSASFDELKKELRRATKAFYIEYYVD